MTRGVLNVKTQNFRWVRKPNMTLGNGRLHYRAHVSVNAWFRGWALMANTPISSVLISQRLEGSGLAHV